MPDTANLPSPSPKTIRVRDLPVRLFHWLLVVTVLVTFLSAEEESALSAWHISSGCSSIGCCLKLCRLQPSRRATDG